MLWEQFLLECLLWVLHSYPCWLVELLKSLLLWSLFLLLVGWAFSFNLWQRSWLMMMRCVCLCDDCPVVACRVLCELCEAVPRDEAIWIRFSCILADILYCVSVRENRVAIFQHSFLQIGSNWYWCWCKFVCEYLHLSHLVWGGSAQIGGEKFHWSCRIFRRSCSTFLTMTFEVIFIKANKSIIG